MLMLSWWYVYLIHSIYKSLVEVILWQTSGWAVVKGNAPDIAGFISAGFISAGFISARMVNLACSSID